MANPQHIHIQKLREEFLHEVKHHGDDTIHPNDMRRVKNDDNWLHRFLMHNDFDKSASLNMMWKVLKWRKTNKINEINEENIKMEYIRQGIFFQRGHDKDGSALFILKCREYVKSSKKTEHLKRCILYWLERLERQEDGRPISLFFDMEGCGIKNIDMELCNYLIGLFKEYYPYFLNYILVYEMSWMLNTAFKVIKSWLPDRAVVKIKLIDKTDVFMFVPRDQALKCWGGFDNYIFSFVPEGGANKWGESGSKEYDSRNGDNIGTCNGDNCKKRDR